MRRINSRNAPSCFLLFALLASATMITAGVLFSITYGNAFTAQSSQSQSQESSQRLAADFTLTDLDGKRISLGQFHGQPVVINFWATWCPPCRSEMPRLAEAYRQEHGQVVFIAISEEPADVVRPFVEQNALPFIMLLDSGGRVSSDYGIRALPTTFFINRDGEIQVRYTGEMSARIIEEGLRRIKE